MAVAVVTVLSGGLPVIDVTATVPKLGLPVTEAPRGIAVTRVLTNGTPVTFVGSDGTSTSAEASAFLARTTGLDATHTSAYTALINGLVADGVWAKLDVLHIYATQNSANALLNLVSSNYAATLSASPPTFTTDRGYTGVNGGSAVYILTNFIPSSASSPKFVQNSAHLSTWIYSEIGVSAQTPMGVFSSSVWTAIFPRNTGDLAYFRINGGADVSVANASSVGHFICNRSSSSTIEGYRNGSSLVAAGSITSSLVNSLVISTCAANINGTASSSPHPISMASIGSSLTSGEALAFYNRLRTYMTAVGVP